MSKYHNKRVQIDGIWFDSTKEGYYYLHFRDMERRGEIRNLRLQVPYEIIPAVYETRIRHLKTKDKEVQVCVQQATRYVADFVYVDTRTGKEEVVDIKSEATVKKDSYILKKKLMRARLGIAIKEIIY